MADEPTINGNLTSLASPDEFATFTIGGRELKVDALTLWDLEESKDDIRALTPDMPWTSYASAVVRIVARKLKPEAGESFAEALLQSCSVPEARNISASFNVLWRLSGFDLGEEEATDETAASPGTGTSTESPPNLPSPSAN